MQLYACQHIITKNKGHITCQLKSSHKPNPLSLKEKNREKAIATTLTIAGLILIDLTTTRLPGTLSLSETYPFSFPPTHLSRFKSLSLSLFLNVSDQVTPYTSLQVFRLILICNFYTFLSPFLTLSIIDMGSYQDIGMYGPISSNTGRYLLYN